MIQAFSHIFNFFNIASPCGDMVIKFDFEKREFGQKWPILLSDISEPVCLKIIAKSVLENLKHVV
jgi:hypothetical protein